MEQIKELLKSKGNFIQFIKFGIVGMSNTIIALVVYYLLIYFHVNYIVADIMGFVAGTFNSYYWNNKYVFEKKHKGNLLPLLKNFMGTGSTSLLGTLLLYVLVAHFKVSEQIAPLVKLIVTIPLNFFINKFWIFK